MLNLSITWGHRKNYPLVVADSTGALVNLDGKTLRFSVKVDPLDVDPEIISKSSGAGIVHAASQSAAGKGLATLTLDEDDTRLATLEAYKRHVLVCQLEIIQTNGQPEVIDSGLLTVEPAVRQTV